MILSASQIESFDATTPFGCERRWWFKSNPLGPKLKEPPTKAQIEGSATHSRLEKYLQTGLVEHLGSRELPAKQYLDPMRTLFARTEEPFAKLWGEHTMKGIIDVVLPSHVHDHKTTSNLSYMKTEDELLKSTQMSVYAWALGHESSRFSQLFIQTRGAAKAKFLSVEVSESQLKANLDRVDGLIKRMEAAQTAPVEELPPSLDKCDQPGRECPFRFSCPRSNNPMSLLSSLLSSPPTHKPEPVVEEVSVLPPDAPPSKPELAAMPVEPKAEELFEMPKDMRPTAPEGPKRGRPLGAKNKPKPPKAEETLSAPLGVFDDEPVNSKLSELPKLERYAVKQVTVRHSTRLGLPGYSSHEFSLEMTAEVKGDEMTAVDELSKTILERIRKEMGPLAEAKKVVGE